jgi:short-subunit dehydrogenase
MTPRETALVTGASSGIGEAFARRFASMGYDVVIVARREDRLQALKNDLEDRFGVHTTVCVADLTTEDGIATVETLIRQQVHLTMLVNNAGFTQLGYFHEVPLERHLALIQLHMVAVTRLCYAAVPAMIQRRRGDIINVSSMSGIFTYPKSSLYNATKAGMNTLSESLNVEMAQYGIRVQALLPGFTRTDIVNTPGLEAFNPNSIPDIMWMDADDVVSDALMLMRKNQPLVVAGLPTRLFANEIFLFFYRRLVIPLMRRFPQRFKLWG